MDNSGRDADDVLRRMLAMPPAKKDAGKLVTQKMVEDLINPLLKQSLSAHLQRPAVAETLRKWLADPTVFETEAAKSIAEHHMKFMLPK